jgi:hypothetical protein
LFAEDVPHYGTAEIQAEDDAAALEAAKTYPLSEVTNDAEWENSVCKRIVFIDDPEGNTIVNDVALDNYDLRHGGDEERLPCDAASDLLKALQTILPAYGDLLRGTGANPDECDGYQAALAAITKATGGDLSERVSPAARFP